jgi:hypothetical protein
MYHELRERGTSDSRRRRAKRMGYFAAMTRWQRRRRSAASLAAGVVLAGAVLLAALGYVAFVLWPRQLSAVPADAPSVPITIAGVVFSVPPHAIRQQVQRRSGAQERIDLAFLWPSLEAPDPAIHPEHYAPSEEPPPIDRLFVTISGADGTLSPAERLKTIYPRYLTGELEAAPDGLLARRFGDATPYRGEDLVFDPNAAEHFVARCSRAAATPGICLLERRIGAADIIVRFPRDWLGTWRDVAARIDALMATLRPPSR